jgi:thymidylate kinase
MKGFFITIYGVNNIGKSTHCRLLTEKLIKHGYDALFLKYPVYDCAPTGPKINKILRSHEPQNISEEELQTLFMQNRKDFEPTLKKMLDEGKIIVAEDYTGTGVAWGTAKGLSQEWVENLNSGLIKEDLAILIAGKRIIRAKESKHIHESNDELVARVGRILYSLAIKNNWRIVPLQRQKEDTAALIWEIVENFIHKN